MIRAMVNARLIVQMSLFIMLCRLPQSVVAQSTVKPGAKVQELLDKALAAQNRGDYRETKRVAEEALSLAREQKDRAGEGIALRRLGVAFGELGQTDKKVEATSQALDIAKEIGD